MTEILCNTILSNNMLRSKVFRSSDKTFLISRISEIKNKKCYIGKCHLGDADGVYKMLQPHKWNDNLTNSYYKKKKETY